MLLAARRVWRQSTRSLRTFLHNASHELHPTIAAPGALASLRYYGAWKASLDGATALDDERPWITFAATRFLERTVRPGSRVFEWGSGGSTLFFRNLGAHTTSIEHDADWYARVAERQANRGAGACHLIPADAHRAASTDSADPVGYASSDPRYPGRSFEAYVRAIDQHPDATFDVILVDGRARPACIQHAIPKLKPSGWLVLDNADREHYQAAIRLLLGGWERRDFAGPIPYTEHFVCTTAWQRRIDR